MVVKESNTKTQEHEVYEEHVAIQYDKFTVTVIERNKPSEKAIQDFQRELGELV